RAGYCQQRLAPQASRGCAQRLQRTQRVVHVKDSPGIAIYFPAFLYYCGDRALFQCGGDVLMSVETLAWQGYKKATRTDGPRVNGISGRPQVLVEVAFGARKLRNPPQR